MWDIIGFIATKIGKSMTELFNGKAESFLKNFPWPQLAKFNKKVIYRLRYLIPKYSEQWKREH